MHMLQAKSKSSLLLTSTILFNHNHDATKNYFDLDRDLVESFWSIIYGLILASNEKYVTCCSVYIVQYCFMLGYTDWGTQ